ncbi:hypothetical protein Ahy_A10g050256 [Arachis hypogaea]|uniref:Uncharacterized protein n=1 Tax=Arachis hypogaea TaxID=3818 RepID=A0A445B8W2_ARAHY|nr:hypothetical protein Ahy_A10g050256 [Arachis hypogaea]
MFHYGGDFKKNVEGVMIYSLENKAYLGDLDIDTLDVFFIRNYHKELGYNDIMHCWWHVPGKGLDIGLRNVNSDKEIREMVKYARTNEGMIDVYFKHGVSFSEVLEGGNTVVYLDKDGGEGCNAKDADVSPQSIKTRALIVAPTPKVVPSHSNTKVYTTSEVTQPPPLLRTPTQPKVPTRNTKPSKTTNPPRQRSPIGYTSPPRPPNPQDPASPQSPRDQVFPGDPVHEDSLFKPGPYESSSSDSEAAENDHKTRSRIRRNKVQSDMGSKNVNPVWKGKEKILHEDGGLVQEVSNTKVNLGFVGCVDEVEDDGLNPGVDSNNTNFWHSEEMETPPNSEDELEEGNDYEEASPLFREGSRFGELHLEIGMKFETKWKFREAVKEYTIQEGRSIKLVKNDNIRCRAVCKVSDCPWVAYASRDHEDTCWQIKTFNDDYTCPREDKNRAANKN